MQRMLILPLLLWTCLTVSTAWAETDTPGPEKEYALEPITITADKQEKEAKDIPGTVSVVTGAQLEDYDIEQTSDILRRTPNLFIVETGPKAASDSFTAVRGITSYMGGNPPMGVYVDDVYYPGYEVNLYDVERVEILKGPQGTLYGHNTEAGVINIITRQPQSEWETKLDAGYGNYDTKTLSLNTGGALVDDKLFLRFSGKVMDTDGYFTNTANDSDTVDEQHELDARASLRWLPSSKWDVRFTTDIQRYGGNYAEFARLGSIKDNPNEVSVNNEGNNEKKGVGNALRASYETDGTKFLSVTAYRYEDTDMDNDLDFTDVDISNLLLDQRNNMVSQEFRLSSNDPDAPFKWLTGAYLFRQDESLRVNMEYIPFNVDFVQKGDTESTGGALFVQTSYLFWDKLEITGGLRYDREDKDFTYSWEGGAAFGYTDQSGERSKLFQSWLPKLAANYYFTEALNAYASIARGSKTGGFNTNYNPGDPFDTEYTWSYETGIKSRWLDNRVEANLSFFLIKWEDMQVEIPISNSVFYVTNAGKATSKGAEAEITARPLKGWEMMASVGVVHCVFDEYNYNGDDLSGNRVPNVPGFSANVGTTYRFDNGFMINAEYMRNSSYYWNVENTQKQGAYQIVNAKVGYERDNYGIYLWGKNLFNTVYVTRAFENEGEWYGRAGAPLTFGLNGTITF